MPSGSPRSDCAGQSAPPRHPRRRRRPEPPTAAPRSRGHGSHHRGRRRERARPASARRERAEHAELQPEREPSHATHLRARAYCPSLLWRACRKVLTNFRMFRGKAVGQGTAQMRNFGPVTTLGDPRCRETSPRAFDRGCLTVRLTKIGGHVSRCTYNIWWLFAGQAQDLGGMSLNSGSVLGRISDGEKGGAQARGKGRGY